MCPTHAYWWKCPPKLDDLLTTPPQLRRDPALQRHDHRYRDLFKIRHLKHQRIREDLASFRIAFATHTSAERS